MNPDYVIPAHCSGEQVYDIARLEMPGRIVRSAVGSRFSFGTARRVVMEGRPAISSLPRFRRLSPRLSPLGLGSGLRRRGTPGIGIARSAAGQHGWVDSSQKVDLLHWRLWPDGTPEGRGSFRFEAVTRHGRNDDYLC